MAASGIRRKVDDLGRVVIPAGMRRALNIREGDAVDVTIEGERVVIARPHNACVFCSREDEVLHRFRNRLVCTDCLNGLGRTDAQVRAVANDGFAHNVTGGGVGGGSTGAGFAGVPVPDPLPPSPMPPDPIPEPQPEPDPDPLPAPGPLPEPEPMPARTPNPAADLAAQLGSGPVDGDALARATAAIPIRRRPRQTEPPDANEASTSW